MAGRKRKKSSNKRKYKTTTGSRPGSGKNFRALSKKVKSPALAAWIGRRKYGAKAFQSMGAKGRRRRSG